MVGCWVAQIQDCSFSRPPTFETCRCKRGNCQRKVYQVSSTSSYSTHKMVSARLGQSFSSRCPLCCSSGLTIKAASKTTCRRTTEIHPFRSGRALSYLVKMGPLNYLLYVVCYKLSTAKREPCGTSTVQGPSRVGCFIQSRRKLSVVLAVSP